MNRGASEELSEETGSVQTGNKKMLVVHFSMPETTNPDNMSAVYSKIKLLNVAVNFLLFIIIADLAVSGSAGSKNLFTFIPIKGGHTVAQTIHLISSYWGFVKK